MRYRIPAGVRVVSWATAIRWFGWGFIETLIPVFVFSFSHSYISTALFSSAFYLFYLLTLPVAGVLSDRISARTLIIISLLLYMVVGTSYFLAGVTGLAIGIIIARIFNGVAFGIDSVARSTFFRRSAPKEHISRVFGHFSALANFFWLIAVVASIFIIKYVPIHYLFLAIPATSLCAIALIHYKLPHDRPYYAKEHKFLDMYKDMWKELNVWRANMWLLAFLNFAIGVIGVVTWFFIPLYVYAQSDNPQHVIFITAIMTVPMLLGNYTGAFIDKVQHRMIFIGLLALIPLLILLPFASYAMQLAIAFCISGILELLNLAQVNIMTRVVDPVKYGRVEGILQVLGNCGDILGAIALSLFIAAAGQDRAAIFLTFVTFTSLIILFHNRLVLMRPEHDGKS
jgi:MFS family permease